MAADVTNPYNPQILWDSANAAGPGDVFGPHQRRRAGNIPTQLGPLYSFADFTGLLLADVNGVNLLYFFRLR